MVLCFTDNWSEIINFRVQFLQCAQVGMMCLGMQYAGQCIISICK